MRSPGLLTSSLVEWTRLQPMNGSLTIKMIGAGEAELTIPEDSPAVKIHDLISIYTEKGLAGVYRVTNAAQNYKKQIDVTLLHGIDILSDSVWADQTTFEGTRAEYITALLNQQTTLIKNEKPWVLGNCHDTGTVKKEINYDRLSDLMEEMEEDGGQYYFSYDFSTWPWTVNYIEKPQNAVCEFRLARNVRTATTTYNDADLCTRLYLAVNVEKTVDDVTSTDTVIRTYNNTEAQAAWGIVAKTADIDTKDDIEHGVFTEADAWAAAFLARRREPSVQIQIDGDELKALTGDTWDEYTIGKLCQVALPDYNKTFVERVVSVTYPDLFKDPGHVTVSLANTLPKFSENLTDARKKADDAKKKATATARGSAKAADLTTWSQTVSYQGAALDGSGVMTLWQSGIDMDAQGGVKIYSLQEGLQSLYAGIEVTASQIRAEVSEGLSGMHSELLMTASQIKAEVDDSLSGIASFVIEASQIRSEVQDALSNLGALVVEASQIRAEVSDALSDFAEFKVEASQIRAAVTDLDGRVGAIEITASQIRQEVDDALGNVGSLIITASQIRGEIMDAANNISTWVQTASQIRGEIMDAANNVSTWTQTASQIKGEIENEAGDFASWVMEASQIKGEIMDASNNVSTWVQTASQIKGEITDAANNVSTWVQTASQIKGEITDASNNVSTWVQEASQIKGEITDATNGLSARITANANRIGLFVNSSDNSIKGNVIVQAINGQSEALIGADKIVLDGSTTVAGVLSVTGSTLYVSQDAVFRGNVSVLNGGTLAAPSLQLFGSGVYTDLTPTNAGNLITELQISQSGNVYTLSKKTVNSDEWTEIGNFNRGSAAVLTGAWDRSAHRYTVTAPGSTPVSTTVGMTGNGQNDSFTVSAFADGDTDTTINNINGFLVVSSSSTKLNNKAEVRLISRSGDTSIPVSSVTLGDVYDKGAASVTVSGAWDNSGTYTATPSNGNSPATTSIGLTAAGTNQPNFTVSAYRDMNTSSTVKSEYVYLVEDSANKRVEARWASSTGTSYGQVSTANTYTAGKNSVTVSGAWDNSGTYTATPSNGNSPATTSIGLTAAGTNQPNFTVSAYRDGNTSSTVKSEYIYLVEDSANKRVEARWASSTGTSYGQVSTANTYTAGANSVTLTRTISGNHIQVDASNGAQSNTYINLTPSEAGGDTPQNYFNVSAYYGTDTNNKLITRTVYITETASSTRSACRVNARWNGVNGTIYAKVDTAATYDAGANAVTLARTISGNRITVNASNGKSSNTYVNLTPSGNGTDSFTVSAYYGTETTNTLISRYVYLAENSSQKRVEARWNSASGTVYGQVSTQATYNAGAAGVTLSDSWSNAKYTVTSSNSKSKSTTIGLAASGSGGTSFTVSAYHDAAANTVKSEYIYLVDNSSQNRIEARWASSTGTVYGQIGYTGASHNITVSDVSSQPGSTSTGSRTNAKSGGISRPPANGYVFFTVKCGTQTKNYYIPINT